MAKKQRVSFVDGILTVEYPTIGKTFKADTRKYQPIVQDCAKAHGYKQKFGDAASGGTPAEKYAEVQSIHASLLAGEWERTAAPDLTPIICEAVARIKRVAYDKVLKLAVDNEETVKTWGTNPKVKAEILKIRAERAAKVAAESNEEVEINL